MGAVEDIVWYLAGVLMRRGNAVAEVLEKYLMPHSYWSPLSLLLLGVAFAIILMKTGLTSMKALLSLAVMLVIIYIIINTLVFA
ncbi:MAG: hypothetical protein QXF26_07365 [Candidatus Bathyarchaeia archaeon]